ncbi:Arabinose operon regulatory protein [compost metagenome]
MTTTNGQFYHTYIANAQLDLSIAAYTKVNRDWNDHRYIPNVNKFYFIVEGEGYLMVDGQEYDPQPGELYLLPAGVVQSYATTSEDTFGKYWCHFTSKVGDLNLFDVLETPHRAVINQTEEMKNNFIQLIHHQRSDQLTSKIRVRSILLEIIAIYLEQCAYTRFNTKTTSTFEKMNTVLKYIEDHAAQHITVEDLAQIAHFQPNYFIHVFKNFTGLSPIQYINRLRLEKARHLLTFTKLSISAIAERVGMELSYFSRAFKDHSGYSPSAYRELMPDA